MGHGDRVRLVTRDRFHDRTGTVVRDAHVLPGVLWLVIAVDPRKDEIPFLLYVAPEEVIPIDATAPPYKHHYGTGLVSAWPYNKKSRKE